MTGLEYSPNRRLPPNRLDYNGVASRHVSGVPEICTDRISGQLPLKHFAAPPIRQSHNPDQVSLLPDRGRADQQRKPSCPTDHPSSVALASRLFAFVSVSFSLLSLP